MQIIPTGADLNAYSLIEGQTGCCSPAAQGDSSGLPMASCCAPGGAVHDGLAGLAAKYDFNAYAASVQVYALKG